MPCIHPYVNPKPLDLLNPKPQTLNHEGREPVSLRSLRSSRLRWIAMGLGHLVEKSARLFASVLRSREGRVAPGAWCLVLAATHVARKDLARLYVSRWCCFQEGCHFDISSGLSKQSLIARVESWHSMLCTGTQVLVDTLLLGFIFVEIQQSATSCIVYLPPAAFLYLLASIIEQPEFPQRTTRRQNSARDCRACKGFALPEEPMSRL